MVFLHLLILFTCSHRLFPPAADTDFHVEAAVSHVAGFKCCIHGVYFQLQTLSAKAPCSNSANNADLW